MRVNKSSWRKVERGMFVRMECSPQAQHGDLQKAGNELIMKIAKKEGLPLLLTLDAHFVNKDQKVVQDLLLQNGRGEDGGLKFFTKYYQLNTEEAWDKWKSLHGNTSAQFVEGVENNHALAAMCERVQLKKEYHLPEVEMSREVIELDCDLDTKYKHHLFDLITRYGRLPDDPVYKARIKQEVKLIAENGKVNLLPYFFAVHDICEAARSLGIEIGAGRGSSAGSLLAYVLMITHVDPIEHDLSFARFLSMGRINRGKLPDIDIDFSDPGRLVECLKAKHGDKFIRVSTTGTNKVKSAIKDVSRVLLSTKDDEAVKLRVDNLCKTIGDIPQGFNDLLGWLTGWTDSDGVVHAGEIETNKDLAEFFDEFQSVRDLVFQVLGIPKSIGRHASAYCLSDMPVAEIVPVCTINNEECTQFTMDAVEAMGLIKFDLLGLNTLKDIGNCVKLIKKRHKISVDIYKIPEDPLIFDEICQGRTETVFQFKGPIPTQTCMEVLPKTILDLASITAACRPGTMYAEMIDDETGESTALIDLWKQRRQGKKDVTFLHPELKEILSPTHGIVLFQEQIAAMFQKSCGYTEEQADEIREIIGKKKADKMAEIIPDIRSRLQAGGWSAQQIQAFISLCQESASYSFNKSHSICYAYIAYICAWLKGHYPLEWWTAILQNSTHEDLEENAKFFHERVKHPDINVSDVDFYIIDEKYEKIVYPLTMIKGIKNAAVELKQNAPYKSLNDLFMRSDRRIVSKRVISALIWSGALDEMPEAAGDSVTDKRNNLMTEYLKLRFSVSKKKEDNVPHVPLSRGQVEMLESKSLCIGNPDIVEFFRSQGRTRCVDIATASLLPADERVCCAGVVVGFNKIKTKKGDDMCFIDMGNKEHKMSVTIFPKLYAGMADKVKEEAVVFVYGKINVYGGRKSILADGIEFYDIDEIN